MQCNFTTVSHRVVQFSPKFSEINHIGEKEEFGMLQLIFI